MIDWSIDLSIVWKTGNNSTMELVAKCVLVVAMIFIASVSGAGAKQTPTRVCNVTIAELAECLPAITGKSPPKPSKNCCNALGKADLHCLCNHKSELSKYGANPAKAMELPKKCNLELRNECQARR